MKDPRTILLQQLLSIGLEKYTATIISLDAGSSQCIVNEKYLRNMNINETILKSVLQKVVLFYCGEFYDD